jgi:glutathione S-transferase
VAAAGDFYAAGSGPEHYRFVFTLVFRYGAFVRPVNDEKRNPMGLTLHYHPLASYCWKVLIALYENGTPFEGRVVDLMDAAEAKAFRRYSPLGKMPALHDDAHGRTVVETSVIIEYLDRHYPGPTRFIPDDPGEALRVRFAERFFDFYVQDPMSKIVTDKIRPEGSHDIFGVEKARAELAAAYDAIETRLPRGMWPEREDFTLADCAALPSLFYAGKVQPFAGTHPGLAAYYDRLARRPSFKRVLEEAEPYFRLFPG